MFWSEYVRAARLTRLNEIKHTVCHYANDYARWGNSCIRKKSTNSTRKNCHDIITGSLTTILRSRNLYSAGVSSIATSPACTAATTRYKEILGDSMINGQKTGHAGNVRGCIHGLVKGLSSQTINNLACHEECAREPVWKEVIGLLLEHEIRLTDDQFNGLKRC